MRAPFTPYLQKARASIEKKISAASVREEEKIRMKQCLVFLLFGIPILLVFAVFNLLRDESIMGSMLLLAAATMAGSWFALLRLRNGQALYILNFTVLGLALIYAFLNGGEDGAKALWMLMFPPICFFLLERNQGIVLSVLFIILLVLIYSLPLPFIDKHHYSSAYLIRYVVVYLIICAVSFWFDYFRTGYRRELEVEHRRFQEILHHSRDILYRRNLKTGRYQYISEAFSRLLGYEREELEALLYDDIEALFHPDDLSAHRDLLAGLLHNSAATTTVPPIELRMRTRNGSYLWFSDQIAVIRDGDNVPEAIVGVNREITRQRELQLALQETRDQFMTILDSLPAHIYVADMHSYQVLFMNNRMKKDFGGDLQGKICWQEFRHGTLPCPHCTNHLLLDSAGQSTGVHEWESYNPIMNEWYNNYDQAIQWNDGRMVRIQIAVNISRQKYLEEERKQNEAIVNRARHLEALGTLTGGIAHDFNNLLQIILGNLVMAERCSGDSPEAREYLTNSREGLDQARELVNKMLALSPTDSNHRVPMSIAPLLSQAATDLPGHKKVSISLNIDTDLWQTALDIYQISTALKNITLNSYESISETGTICITAENHLHRETAVPLEANPSGRYLKISIKDNGTGIAENVLPRIFEPYFSTKQRSSFKGLGLGLTIAHSIISRHNGHITVHSTPMIGTEVTIYLAVAGTGASPNPLVESLPGFLTN